MTYTTKIRSNPGALVTAEYECPLHGRFDATVCRGAAGDPPEHAPCPGEESWGRCAVGEQSPWRPSAVRGRVKLGEVDQGKVQDCPSDRCLDTRALADDPTPGGYERWKKTQNAITRDENITRRRANTGRGGKVYG